MWQVYAASRTPKYRPTRLPPATTTIHFLVRRPAPPTLPVNRLPFERLVYTVTAAVTLVRQEQDGDLHLVLRAGADHMIAEAPSPSCDSKATSLRRTQMTAARARVRVCAHARVTGVAFSTSNTARPVSRRTRSSSIRSWPSAAHSTGNAL